MDNRASPKGPSRLGLIAAYRWEVTPLLRHGAQRVAPREYLLKLPLGDAVLMLGGSGAANAQRAGESLVARYRLSALASIGFAGGLAEGLSAGKLLLANSVVDDSSGRSFPCASTVLSAQEAMSGRLVTVRAVAGRVDQKAALKARWDASAADMEAAAVAQIAHAAGVPFTALKAITDGPNDDLAIDFEKCLNHNGGLSSSKIVIQGFQGIVEFRTLCLLARNSRIAAIRLALALNRA